MLEHGTELVTLLTSELGQMMLKKNGEQAKQSVLLIAMQDFGDQADCCLGNCQAAFDSCLMMEGISIHCTGH